MTKSDEKTWTAGVAAAVVDGERVLLVRHTYGEKVGRWAMPGGYAKPNERLDQAAVREVKEEVGLQTEVIDAIALVTQTSAQGGAVFVVFRLRPLAGVATPDGVEVDRVGWFTVEEVRALGQQELWPDSRNPALAALCDDPGLVESPHYPDRSEKARAFITSAIGNPRG
jgi:ADP-ribose pyrophosphatase YjhB (NUDIX family)